METQNRIIQAAMELFIRYGIRSVSMDDIARQLSISKKTLYQHFKDKEEIINVATRKHMEMEKEEYEEIFQSSKNAVDELAQISKCMRRDFRDINPSVLYDLKKYHHQAWNIWLDFKDNYIIDSMVRNLHKGIEEGYFRKEIDPETLAIFRLEQVQLAFDERIFPRDRFDLRDVQIKLFDHFVHGIVTEKGRQLWEEYTKSEQINQTQ